MGGPPVRRDTRSSCSICGSMVRAAPARLAQSASAGNGTVETWPRRHHGRLPCPLASTCPCCCARSGQFLSPRRPAQRRAAAKNQLANPACCRPYLMVLLLRSCFADEQQQQRRRNLCEAKASRIPSEGLPPSWKGEAATTQGRGAARTCTSILPVGWRSCSPGPSQGSRPGELGRRTAWAPTRTATA